MRMRWFGEPWGEPWGEDGRAAVCNQAFRIAKPVGVACASDCGEEIEEGDRGIVTAYGVGRARARDEWETSHVFDIAVRGEPQTCVAYHIDCFVGMVLPNMRHAIERRP